MYHHQAALGGLSQKERADKQLSFCIQGFHIADQRSQLSAEGVVSEGVELMLCAGCYVPKVLRFSIDINSFGAETSGGDVVVLVAWNKYGLGAL